MGNIPHIIEIALLLLIAFLIGCVIGWLLRTKIFKRTAIMSKPAPASSTTSTAVSAIPEISKTPAPVPIDEEKTGAVSIVAAKSVPAPKPGPKAVVPKAAKPKSAAPKPVPKTPADADRPQGLSAPRAGGKDDLKKIKGVGPKLEGMLNGLGIYHFDQIAAWKRAEIDWVDDYLSFKGRIDRDDWITQAKDFS